MQFIATFIIVSIGIIILCEKLISGNKDLFIASRKTFSKQDEMRVACFQSSQKSVMIQQREAYPSGALKYCNGVDTLSETNNASIEGTLPFDDKSQFKLLQVYILLRHGDRMPLYSSSKVIPTPKLNCSLPDFLEPHRSVLNNFKLISLTDNLTLSLNLHNGPQVECTSGLLTDMGYYQHYITGQYIRKTYSQLLTKRKFLSSWQEVLFTHSTNYERTQQSAASFLVGLLGDEATDVPIHVSKGITLYGLPPGSKAIYRWCPKLRDIIAKELSSGEFRSGQLFFSNVTERVAADMGVSLWKLPAKITQLYDQIMVRACHGMPPPCGKVGCIDHKLLQDIASYADWTTTYTYPMGTAVLMMQPFIYNTLFQQMNKAIVKDKNGEKDYLKLLLHFCHDTTLAAIMTTLALPQKKIMPYGSRLTFELWKREKDPSKMTTEDTWYYSPYFVRILVNGQTVTHDLQLSLADFELARELVKFRAWKDYVTRGKFRSKESYDSVCGISLSSKPRETVSIPKSEQGGE